MSLNKLLPKTVGQKVVLTMALFVFITGSSIGLLSYFTSEKILSNRMESVDMDNLLTMKTASIQKVILGAVKVSRMLASNNNLMTWFDNKEKSDERKAVSLELLRFIATDMGYPIVFAVNAATNNYWTQKSEKPNVLSPKNKSDSWFYSTIKEPAGTIKLDLDTSEYLGGTYIFVNVLMGKPSGKTTGVAGIGFPIEQLITQFINHNYGTHGKVWLINNQGIIQVAEDKTTLGKNIRGFVPTDIAEKLLAKRSEAKTFSYNDPKLGDIIYGVKAVNNTPWIAIISIEKGQWLNQTLEPIRNGIVYSALAAVFIISIFSAFLAQTKVSQLIDISRAITALGRKNFTVNLAPKLLEKKDEVGDMARGYEQSRENLSEAYLENERILRGLEDTVEIRTKEIQHINDMACIINSTLDFNDILAALYDQMQNIFAFNQIGIFLLNDNQSELSATHFIGAELSKQSMAEIKQLSFSISNRNIFAKTLLDEQPNYIDEVSQTVINHFSEEDRAFFELNPYKSCLSLPLVVKKNVIGTIVFSNTKTVMKLDDEDRNKILRYVIQIANAIQNAQLFNDLKSTKLQLLETEKIASMTRAFERFVPKQFLDRLTKSVEDVEVGMVQCSFITILFSDIRNFTNLSESMMPQDLLRFLNSYLSRMNQVIMSNNGFIDKFIGDAIMGIFDEQGDNHYNEAYLAVKTAIEMHQSLNGYNENRIKNGYLPVSIGIGIHSGPVVVGTVGSEDRLQTTVLGDTVNAAARLEGITKLYNANTVISQQTQQFIKTDPKMILRTLDYVQVKGKEEAMRIYEVINCDPPEIQELKSQIMLRYQTGLDNYYKREWDMATELFTECLSIFPDDAVCKLYLNRIAEYKQNPPDEDWEGIYVATSK
jgi:class 3 adenylate cyclase